MKEMKFKKQESRCIWLLWLERRVGQDPQSLLQDAGFELIDEGYRTVES